jgi:hypothetical protein
VEKYSKEIEVSVEKINVKNLKSRGGVPMDGCSREI